MPPPAMTRLVGLLAVAGLALGPPALANWAGVTAQLPRPVAWTLVIVYELVVMVLAFSSSVLSALKERWVSRVTDTADTTLQRWFRPYRSTYLRYVRATNSFIDLKGLTTRGEFTLRLDDVFVELSVDAETLQRLRPNPVSYGSDLSEQRSVWHWVLTARAHNEPLVIIGPPGSGKTTLLRHIAYTLATGSKESRRLGVPLVQAGPGRARRARPFKRIPVMIELKRHTDKFLDDVPPTLDALIRDSFKDIGRTEPPGWVEHHLTRSNFMLLFDGLDEMTERTARTNFSSWIDRQRAAYQGNVFVLTSRPFGYSTNPLDVATVAHVRPFTTGQIHSFLGNWYRATTFRSFGERGQAAQLAAKKGYEDLIGRIDASAQLRELAANPLLLTMIANVHNYRGALPGRRSELYGEVCEVFLGKRHQARGVPTDLTSHQRQLVLQHLAFYMMDTRQRELPTRLAADTIAGPLSTVTAEVDPEEFLHRVEQSSGILVEQESGVYGFAHLTFQEYLAACYIKEKQLTEVLPARVGDGWWRECVLLYSAIADATSIVTACLAEVDHGDDSQLALAVTCVDESREVSNKIRHLISEMSKTDGVRDDPSRRRTAGILQLLLGDREYVHVSQGRNVSRPITNLEYQAFIDSQAEPRHPDHWHERVYPPQADNEPASGIRCDDAAAFANWLAEIHGNKRVYRLPLLDEVHEGVLGFDYAVYAQQHSNLNTVAAWGPTTWPIPEPLVLNSGDLDDQFLGLTRHLLTVPAGADVGNLARILEETVQNLTELATTSDWAKQHPENATRILQNAQHLGDQGAAALARSADPRERRHELQKVRFAARQATAILNQELRIALARFERPHWTKQRVESIRRWIRRDPLTDDERSQSITIKLGLLIHNTAIVFVQLAILEDRILGVHSATERLHIIREG